VEGEGEKAEVEVEEGEGGRRGLMFISRC